jgi:hypothetical protein
MKTANRPVCQGIGGASSKARKESDLACPLGVCPVIVGELKHLCTAMYRLRNLRENYLFKLSPVGTAEVAQDTALGWLPESQDSPFRM